MDISVSTEKFVQLASDSCFLVAPFNDMQFDSYCWGSLILLMYCGSFCIFLWRKEGI